MGCPKCGSEEIDYIPEHRDEDGERVHRALLGRELGNAYKHPAGGVFALGLAGVVWLTKAFRHNWECQKCHHTWHVSEADDGSDDQSKENEKRRVMAERSIPMLKRFTEPARRSVLLFGVYEASQAGSHYIEPQHVLLGLLREFDPLLLPLILLCSLGPEAVQTIRGEIESTFPPGNTKSTIYPALSPAVGRICTYAAEEAKSQIGTGHLLLGILREETAASVAAILHKHGLQLSIVREKLAAANIG